MTCRILGEASSWCITRSSTKRCRPRRKKTPQVFYPKNKLLFTEKQLPYHSTPTIIHFYKLQKMMKVFYKAPGENTPQNI